jgi:hypothetical protein
MPDSSTGPPPVPRALIHRLREALVPALSQGSWSAIEDDHRKLGMTWREDFSPGWGKPKYVARVLDELADEEVVPLARRAIERFPDRCAFAVEDALLWCEARGTARVTEVTRIGIAKSLDGRRIHPRESPTTVLGTFARSQDQHSFEYSDTDEIVAVEVNPFSLFDGSAPQRFGTRSSHLELLDAYGFRSWPDARLFRLLELLVHPTVRQGVEQATFVHALNAVLLADGFQLAESDRLSGHTVFTVRSAVLGVAGRPKNLIFASNGPKPELGFADAVNNDIVILRHAEHCLVYDDTISEDGLRWSRLVEWWAIRERLDPSDLATRKALADRLIKSLDSAPERRLFNAYFKIVRPRLADALPALIPQVYLHYDPINIRELHARGDDRRFAVQRMDFLLLLPHNVRVVLEVDGQQHYSTGLTGTAKPSPSEYARTVRGDRQLRLAGYEVYRFGGHELQDETYATDVLEDFFTRLIHRHRLGPK